MGQNARGQWHGATDAEDPDYAAGFWYTFHGATGLSAGAVLPANTLRLLPFKLRQLVNISGLGLRISTLAAGGNVQLGIYGANRDTLLPTGIVKAFSPNFATDAAVTLAANLASGPVQFPRGIYWLGVNADATAGGVVAAQTVAASGQEVANLVGAAALGSILSGALAALFCRSVAATFGTWPDLTSPTATTETATTACATGAFLVQA